MENVLRAMDVIPPFDSHSAPDRPGLRHVPDSPPMPPEKPAPTFAVKGSESNENDQAVPTLDLGEKILAEQRRRTARKRRAPGSHEADPDLGQQAPVVPTARLSESSGEQLTELQQLVSDIVARDIARLYEGVQRTSQGVLGS